MTRSTFPRSLFTWTLPPLPPHFEAALRDVHAKRPESRMAAAERLGHAQGDERERAFAGLFTLANDAHPDVRATALAGLGMLGDERALDVVLAHFDDPEPGVREFAALAAAQIGGERALEALRKALRSSTPQVRFQAVAAVAELAPESITRDVAPLLSDSDGEVRMQAVIALASLEEPHLSGHLSGVLDDPVFAVRLEAALALAHLEDNRGEAVLLEALEKRERVHEVAPALAAIGAKAAIEPLARIAMSFLAPAEMRAVTSAALIRLSDPRGVAGLRRILRGLRSDVRSYAVELAAETGALDLLDDIVRFVDRPRGVDPVTLAQALASFSLRSAQAKNALERLANRGGEAGQVARQALQRRAPDAPHRE